VIDEDWMTAVV